MIEKVESEADLKVRTYLDKQQSFALIAGAGSGKTSSLVEALERIRDKEGHRLRQNGQRVACITFTNRAVAVIKNRLGFDNLYLVSTMHSFLWDQIYRFQYDISEALRIHRLPSLISKERAKDNGSTSRRAIESRAKADRLEQILAILDRVKYFNYSDTKFSDYSNGQLGHEDIIAIASYLFENNEIFRRLTGFRFPYIFVDEAQDTFEGIVAGLNLVCESEGLPIVGYFGDPWQQIYDGSIGTFTPPKGGITISKSENFRCSESVIRLLNAFRNDVKQYAAGKNKGSEGSVLFRLVRAEVPEMPRNRYSDDQLMRALEKLDTALTDWGWNDRNDVIKLFLVRQMIARRMGFLKLNQLFNGPYASSRAEDAFEKGEHFLLLPLTMTIYPLVAAYREKDDYRIIDLLRRNSPAFAPDGLNSKKTLKNMIDISHSLKDQLEIVWESSKIKEVLQFCVDKKILLPSEKLVEHLNRAPRAEEYQESIHELDKGDWLADSFFNMDTTEIPSYSSFILNNTAYSTQHGVKGEEYPKVLVVYDDVEANWQNYSFSKILTPGTAGVPTDGQNVRSRNLAYVSFSRAQEDLRVLFFTSNPEGSRQELIDKQLLYPDQIELV